MSDVQEQMRRAAAQAQRVAQLDGLKVRAMTVGPTAVTAAGAASALQDSVVSSAIIQLGNSIQELATVIGDLCDALK